ncbi:bromodomain and WD repeat-containing DDB_G0285837 isoform X2 [Leptopilina boulardi]|nr:bromodomain and WD repeat-containing DDB_G0285837 isoform X2 [Leptopilina boulardi]XP_051164820.1 bromodomain and WD repeat-containing DDB_G0285837 isoform X2 [Leptopilina boulardi]
MTLHWWMHWFWITGILAVPLPSTTEGPKLQDENQMSTTDSTVHSTTITKLDDNKNNNNNNSNSNSSTENFRIAKAIGVSSSVNAEKIIPIKHSTPAMGDILTLGVYNDKVPVIRMPIVKKDSKISWIITSNKTSRTKYDEKMLSSSSSEIVKNFSTSEYESLTVLPLQEEISRFKLVVNNKSTPFSATGGKLRTVNVSEDLLVEEDLTAPQLIATASSILDAELSDSTRLSRARSAFSSDFQRDQKHDESPRSQSSDSGKNCPDDVEDNGASVADIAIITGSCLASLALLSTLVTVGFIMYRKKYLNPPQSLNSDKCSNPDSSGYIDDSTIRDNSEEMYSLDNDSFLNSLEAMTIQNYWTDSVKHTKL